MSRLLHRAKADSKQDAQFRAEIREIREAAAAAEEAAASKAGLSSQQVWGSLADLGPEFEPLAAAAAAGGADDDGADGSSKQPGPKKRGKKGAAATAAAAAADATAAELPKPPPGPKAAALAAFKAAQGGGSQQQQDAQATLEELRAAAKEEAQERAALVAELEDAASRKDWLQLKALLDAAPKKRYEKDPAINVAKARLERFRGEALVAKAAATYARDAGRRAADIERLAVSARLRPMCLGSDRAYRSYWILPGDMSRVFVQARGGWGWEGGGCVRLARGACCCCCYCHRALLCASRENLDSQPPMPLFSSAHCAATSDPPAPATCNACCCRCC
jgi:hypothetical protein